MALTIWVDADACPGAVRDVVVRAALRRQVATVFVANKLLAMPSSPYLNTVLVSKGADVVDAHIVEHAQDGDLVVTQDIPLAAALVARGITVLSLHGEIFDADNVRERLSIRDFMHQLREEGVITGGPAPFGGKASQAFANAFDRELSKALRRSPAG